MTGISDANGSLVFSDVKPQRYELNAVKKEYSIGKAEVLVDDYDHALKVIVGERIAFTAYGTVVNLAG